MSRKIVTLKKGLVANLKDARLGVVHVYRRSGEEDVEVLIAVMAEEEQEFSLKLGDTFKIREQLWKLDAVEDLGEGDWVVTFTEVSD